MQNLRKIIETYFESLETANLQALKNLFAKDAIIHSPLYGNVPFEKFYTDLFNDTSQSVITLLDIFESINSTKVAAAQIKYEWTLRKGARTSFVAVDIFQFNEGKITEVTIIYDTFKTRDAFQRRD